MTIHKNQLVALSEGDVRVDVPKELVAQQLSLDPDKIKITKINDRIVRAFAPYPYVTFLTTAVTLDDPMIRFNIIFKIDGVRHEDVLRDAAIPDFDLMFNVEYELVEDTSESGGGSNESGDGESENVTDPDKTDENNDGSDKTAIIRVNKSSIVPIQLSERDYRYSVTKEYIAEQLSVDTSSLVISNITDVEIEFNSATTFTGTAEVSSIAQLRFLIHIVKVAEYLYALSADITDYDLVFTIHYHLI